MGDKINDGGPAFPHESYDFEADMDTVKPGMTLRDWFAGQALRARWGNGEAMTPEDAARMAYQLADAMLEAREFHKKLESRNAS